MQFSDILYGSIQLPDWLLPFLKLPEFLRLRGVRLSNVDSFQFKDFNGPTRWDHGLAVASLALRCAERRQLDDRQRVHLVLAALLHDVGTAPFAHTAEYVLENFDHEIESQHVLGGQNDDQFHPDLPVFACQLPRFRSVCESTSSKIHIRIDPDEVSRIIVGEGELGFLIQGTLDLDNADNVTRACLSLGHSVDGRVPLKIADWLAEQSHVPNLDAVSEPAVQEWLSYKTKLYQTFFESSDEELGRQAFLQHLMRRAVHAGLPRPALIWTTDEGLLTTIEHFDDPTIAKMRPSLSELVLRYRLMEAPAKLAQVEIEDDQSLRALKNPAAAAWLERELSAEGMETMVMVASRRFEAQTLDRQLFPPALGMVLYFKLGQGIKRGQIPTNIADLIPPAAHGHKLEKAVALAIRKRTAVWAKEKPWDRLTNIRKNDVLQNLRSVGSWSFRLSRNASLHSYPSTFVYAIPANLIMALGLRGDLVVDPFGGTGQTAVEAIKYGGRAVSADSNRVASLAAAAKLTYLPPRLRDRLRTISPEHCLEADADRAPRFELIDRWFHPRTIHDLCRIRGYIARKRDPRARQFLQSCFSAIITQCTGRHGEQHGYFADNCPLPKGVKAPQYQPAAVFFIDRLRRSLRAIENFYAIIQRDHRDPEVELGRAKVLTLDVTTATVADYDLTPGSVDGIVTSPPYLCMSDYVLGQRLSYEWMFEGALPLDFAQEIGARRLRFQSAVAITQYFDAMGKFAKLAAQMIRPGGFLATVLGAPVAERFKDISVLEKFDRGLSQHGFELLWEKERTINWHRNHGYARLKNERVAVHVRR